MTDGPDLDHSDADLIGLLTGETDRQRAVETARHLKVCPQCADELIDLAVAHGALRSAEQALRDLGGDGGATDPAGDPHRDPLPPLAVAPAAPTRARRPARRTTVAVLAAVAAVVVLVAALGLGGAFDRGTPGRSVVAQAPLHPIDAPADATGLIVVVASGSTRQMTVTTKDLGSPGPQSYYEVWLLDPSTLKMLPVGVLPPSGAGTYAVTAGIMAGYSAVDVSLQADDGDPAHSTTSVLRAVYAGPASPVTST